MMWERCTACRSFGWPGSSSAEALSTQTSTSPVAAPSRAPAAESKKRNGVSLRPCRRNEPAKLATAWSSIAPTAAPTRPAIGVHGEAAPPCSRCGPTREPAYAPAASPASESALAISPRRSPPSAATATMPSATQSTVVSDTWPVSQPRRRLLATLGAPWGRSSAG